MAPLAHRFSLFYQLVQSPPSTLTSQDLYPCKYCPKRMGFSSINVTLSPMRSFISAYLLGIRTVPLTLLFSLQTLRAYIPSLWNCIIFLTIPFTSLLRLCKTSPWASPRVQKSWHPAAYLPLFLQAICCNHPTTLAPRRGIAKFFFTPLFTTSLLPSRPTSCCTIHFPAPCRLIRPTLASNGTLVQHLDDVPLYTTFPASPRFFPKFWNFAMLCQNYPSSRRTQCYPLCSVSVLPNRFLYHRRSAALYLSCFGILPISTTSSRTLVAYSSPTSTSSPEHTLLCHDLAQPSHLCQCEFLAYEQLRHLTLFLHPLL